MEPRQSMTRYAALVVVALSVRSLTGSAPQAAYGGAALMLAGVVLAGGHRIAVRRAPGGA